jgi:hypothetical protein
MTQGSLVERLALLAAVALLGGVVALAVGERRAENATSSLIGAPAPGGWNEAFTGSRGPAGDAQRTTCGQVLATGSLGVTHPVLPCGTKIVLRHGGSLVLTEVIDNTLVEPGRQLEVTEKLAQMLEIEGTEPVQWRFATAQSG